MLLHSWREKKFWGFYSKWLLWQPVTAFGGFIWYHWRQQSLLFYKTRFDFQTSISCRFLFYFVLFNKLKFWQLVLVFSALYRLYLGITLFCTKPSEQIVYFHVTDVKMLRFFLFYWITTLLVFDYSQFWEFIFNTLQSRNVSAKSAGSKVGIWEKCA